MMQSNIVRLLPIPLLLLGAALIYSAGLDGPFLLDDHVHISQNRWVKIEALDWQSLVQAWNSSFAAFPSDRPLAQLSFGITHALSGLDPWAYKAVNLALHLLTGVLVFVFVRLSQRALDPSGEFPRHTALLATVVAAFWLLNPMHVSTVLYIVQRMAQLSTLSLLAGLIVYVHGRLQIARGEDGRLWMLSAAPIALVGFFGKENTVLLPLLLLSCELTLLARVSTAPRKTFIRGIWALYIALPIAVAVIFLAFNSGMLSYEGRPFDLRERLLTQPRVIWTYISWLFVPDISGFSLFHDDLVISRDWLTPPTTAVAILALLAVTAAALLYRRRFPVFAFAVLFFLANHALESTFFPLEMMFEHRNYLASLGPLFLLGHLIVVQSEKLKKRQAALFVGVLLLLSHSVVTHFRVDNWSSLEKFALTAASNHPTSKRSNFLAAQLLISMIGKSTGNTDQMADAASGFLDAGLRADERCLDCLFGKIALALHVGTQPARETLDKLVSSLESGDVGPTKVSANQFSFLARWHKSDGEKLPADDIESIFDAALANPGWRHDGRAGIEAAYREYHEFVTGDLAAAEQHARAAIAAWPEQWGYHVQLVQVLRKRGLEEDALAALDAASASIRNNRQQQDFEQVKRDIEHSLQTAPNGNT